MGSFVWVPLEEHAKKETHTQTQDISQTYQKLCGAFAG